VTPLAIVFGSVGAVLLIVGMVGGNIEFSGAVIPEVGKVARVLSTATGGILVIFALSVAFLDLASTPGTSITPTTSQAAPVAPGPAASESPTTPAAPSSSSSTVTAPIQAGGVGGLAYLFADSSSAAPIVAELPHGYVVEIVCTVQGEAVTSELTGVTSSLWNGVDAGGVLGFVPDVYVETGTYQAVMPSCGGTGA
jgi:hypothetical protein